MACCRKKVVSFIVSRFSALVNRYGDGVTRAKKTSIAADAQAEANRKLAESLSDTLIEYQKIQKWDGKLPTVSGGNALVSIDPAE